MKAHCAAASLVLVLWLPSGSWGLSIRSRLERAASWTGRVKARPVVTTIDAEHRSPLDPNNPAGGQRTWAT